MEERNLQAIDGATLMGLHLEPTRFCVDTLLPQGVCFLGGASKIGKSWMVLDWCVRIAKGEPVWGLPTQKGTTLYLCLGDTLRRVQDRLNRITEAVSYTHLGLFGGGPGPFSFFCLALHLILVGEKQVLLFAGFAQIGG